MWKTPLSTTKYKVANINKILELKEGDKFWEIEKVVLSKVM
jgi:hypothetical protein